MIFQQNRFSWYIHVTDQISLSNCLYFLKYLAICALQLFDFHVVPSCRKKEKSKVKFSDIRFALARTRKNLRNFHKCGSWSNIAASLLSFQNILYHFLYSQHSSIIWQVWLNGMRSGSLWAKWLWVRIHLQSLKWSISPPD